jgi:4'-phosphopantetheinyl transferase
MGAIGLSPGAPLRGAPGPNELYLTLIDLRQAAAAEVALRCFLSRDEVERAGRFQFDAGRSQFVLTRGWLRVVLSRALGAAPEQLLFSYGARGKPALAGEYRDAALSFNVSHSGHFALIGLATGRPVGVDIEQLRATPDFESIATEYFSSTERRAIFGFPEIDRLRAFFRCWTRKEAFMKATGAGMEIALDGFSVSLEDDGESRISASDVPGHDVVEWAVSGLSLVPDCEAAVCAAGAGARVSAWIERVSI